RAASVLSPLSLHDALPIYAARVGAEVRLRQPEAADSLAPRHARQPLLLLLLGAVGPDREHRQRSLHGDEAAESRVARLQLQAGEDRKSTRLNSSHRTISYA